MRKFLVIVFLLLSAICFAQVKVENLLTENLINPIGLDATSPRFSWQLRSDKRNIMQTAYEIEVVLDKSIVWNSNKITSGQSVHVPYAGNALQSGKKYSWRVKVWGNQGKESEWSDLAFFQMALLNKNDWKAKWIEPLIH